MITDQRCKDYDCVLRRRIAPPAEPKSHLPLKHAYLRDVLEIAGLDEYSGGDSRHRSGSKLRLAPSSPNSTWVQAI
jgi:hypothetical protein